MEILHEKKLKFLEEMANLIRQDIIEMLLEAKSGHSAGPLGMTDVFTALYFHILNHKPKMPNWEHRNYFHLLIVQCRLVKPKHFCVKYFFLEEELKTLR